MLYLGKVSRWAWPVSVVAFTITLAVACPVSAHDSPGDVVHALTHRIETTKPTARLLAARGFEYEYLGQWEDAVADFEAALKLQPNYGAAVEGLARTLLRLGQLDRAASAARDGLALDPAPEKQAPYYAVLAQTYRLRKAWPLALEAWRAALRTSRPEVDWFLGEAECLARLDAYTERARALEVAKGRNPSVVLHRAWIEALVDAGELDSALPEIEAGLERAHWKSTWLLLRARLYAARGKGAAQQADAQAALDEIKLRWSWEHPDQDPYLFAYAGLAFGLMEEPELARENLEKARSLGVPEARITTIERALTQLKVEDLGGPQATRP